jgi:hypothetical protein
MRRCWCWPLENQGKVREQFASNLTAGSAATWRRIFRLRSLQQGFSLATHTANPSIGTSSMPPSPSVSRTKQ